MAARIIVKLVDPRDKREWYMEWSTVVDAPTTVGMTYEKFLEWYKEEYGVHGAMRIFDRLRRVNKTGCSLHGHTVADLIENNRAGDDDENLTLEQIIDQFCIAPEDDKKELNEKAS